VWWHISVIPAFKKQRQEDLKFKVSLDYRVGSCVKKKKKTKGGYLLNPRGPREAAEAPHRQMS
jgi:hypothetical protein